MVARTDSFDLGQLGLTAGEARRMTLGVVLDRLRYGGETYEVDPLAEAVLDATRMTGGGWSLRLRFEAGLTGPCMRCLEPAAPRVTVDAREVDQPGGGDELSSPYVEGEVLDLHAWARDAYALALPVQVVCSADCAGLCPECGTNLNEAGPEHGHERAPDLRWAKLRELRLE